MGNFSENFTIYEIRYTAIINYNYKVSFKNKLDKLMYKNSCIKRFSDAYFS